MVLLEIEEESGLLLDRVKEDAVAYRPSLENGFKEGKLKEKESYE